MSADVSPPSKPSRRRRIGWAPLTIGAVALVAVAAVLVSQAAGVLTPLIMTGIAAGPTPTAQTPTAASGPDRAVKGYLEALAANDAVTALSWASSVPSDTSLLTSAVLRESSARAQLTAITIGEPTLDGESATVPASYHLGERQVETRFEVQHGTGGWRLVRITSALDLADLDPGTGLEVNGIKPATGQVQVFPGSYQIATVDGRFAVARDTVLALSPNETPRIHQVRLELSKQGLAAVRKAAKKKLTWCLEQRAVEPKGCGFRIALGPGLKPRLSTLSVTLLSGSVSRLTVRLSLADPLLASGRTDLRLRVRVASTDGRLWQATQTLRSVAVDLSDAKKIEVAFN